MTPSNKTSAVGTTKQPNRSLASRRSRRLRASLVIAVAGTIVGASVANADHRSSIQRIGRLFGVGWGDGYHVCHDGGLRPGADLPPAGYPQQFGPKKHCGDGCGGIYPAGTALPRKPSASCDSGACDTSCAETFTVPPEQWLPPETQAVPTPARIGEPQEPRYIERPQDAPIQTAPLQPQNSDWRERDGSSSHSSRESTPDRTPENTASQELLLPDVATDLDTVDLNAVQQPALVEDQFDAPATVSSSDLLLPVESVTVEQNDVLEQEPEVPEIAPPRVMEPPRAPAKPSRLPPIQVESSESLDVGPDLLNGGGPDLLLDGESDPLNGVDSNYLPPPAGVRGDDELDSTRVFPPLDAPVYGTNQPKYTAVPSEYASPAVQVNPFMAGNEGARQPAARIATRPEAATRPEPLNWNPVRQPD